MYIVHLGNTILATQNYLTHLLKKTVVHTHDVHVAYQPDKVIRMAWELGRWKSHMYMYTDMYVHLAVAKHRGPASYRILHKTTKLAGAKGALSITEV